MNESDKEFLRAFEACRIPNSEFRHRDHVRAAWLYVVRDGLPSAIISMQAAIRRFAIHHGGKDKFHVTLTRAWVTFVAAHVAGHRYSTFDLFVSANPELLDKALALRFYSRERLLSDEARVRWVPPDLRRMPQVR